MADHFGFLNICNPLLCLLGAIGDEKIRHWAKLFIRLLCFYEWKLIARRWIYTETFTLAMWEKLVNADLTLYKMTYGDALKNVPNLALVGGLSSYCGVSPGRLSIWGTIGWGCFVLEDCPSVGGGKEMGSGRIQENTPKVLYAVLLFFLEREVRQDR